MAYQYKPYEEKQYVPSASVNQARDAWQHNQALKPQAYQSQWQPQIKDLTTQYQSRGPFNYDINSDALYQQAAQRYIQQGQQAMMDTMGQAAALTGGYGNSYAQTVGQQTYNGYLQGLNDKIADYYGMALQRYQMEGDDMLNQLSLLNAQEDRDYGRWMDNWNMWNQEDQRLQGAYDSERQFDYGKYTGDRAFDYGRWSDQEQANYRADRDAQADAQWQQEWQRQQERDRVQDAQWDQQWQRQLERDKVADDQWEREMALREASARSGGGGGGYTVPTVVPTTTPRNSTIKNIYDIYKNGNVQAAKAATNAYYKEKGIKNEDDRRKRGQQ